MANGAVIAVKPEAFRLFQYPTPPLHVRRTRVEDAWVAGQERAAQRLAGVDAVAQHVAERDTAARRRC
nr:hypothetical protein OG781_19530 [Streptomyces sp. NBC_00830]